MQLVINTKNTTIRTKSGRFFVFMDEKERTISPSKLSSIAIMQSSCTITASAVLLAVENQIPILFFTVHGRLKGRLWSPHFGSIATLRRKQIIFAERSEATQWIIKTFHLKTDIQRQTLHWLANKKPVFKNKIEKSIHKTNLQLEKFELYNKTTIQECRNNLQGIEGNIAKIYWQTLKMLVPDAWKFENRNRRPAQDSFNAAINYLYGMLYPRVEGALIAAGLDAHLGFLHADQYNKPTLSFDTIEPFRPWTDRLVLELILTKRLQAQHFEKKVEGTWLNSKGKQLIIPAFKKWMKEKVFFEHKKGTRFNHIHNFAVQLAKEIDKTID